MAAGLPPQTTAEDLCDWDRMCAGLAAAEPWWEPGTRFGYHALTFGFLLGETIRRATGQTVTELLTKYLHRDGRGHGLPHALGLWLHPRSPWRCTSTRRLHVRHDRLERLGRLR